MIAGRLGVDGSIGMVLLDRPGQPHGNRGRLLTPVELPVLRGELIAAGASREPTAVAREKGRGSPAHAALVPPEEANSKPRPPPGQPKT